MAKPPPTNRKPATSTSDGGSGEVVLSRVIVIGTSGSGKTTFANRLAGILQTSHIELDTLFWNPEWTPKEMAEFRHLVEQAIAQERWVIDGNYRHARDMVWPRATAVIWLNFPFLIVLWRIFKRTVTRVVRRKELYANNRETFRKAFLSKESILWWVITTYARRRREFSALRSGKAFPNLAWLEFRRPRQADAFLYSLSPSGLDQKTKI